MQLVLKVNWVLLEFLGKAMLICYLIKLCGCFTGLYHIGRESAQNKSGIWEEVEVSQQTVALPEGCQKMPAV